MKKTYMYILIFLLLIFVGFLVFNFFSLGTLRVDSSDKVCNVDEDCVMAMVKCSCDCGVPINKLNWKKYLDRQDQMCKFYFGPMCGMGCDQELRCINNICTSVNE